MEYSPIDRLLDSLSFYTFKVGVMYLGLTPFPISTRNSAVAVAHLVSKTGVKQMFVSSDPAMQRLAQEANEHLAKDGLEFEVLPMPLFEDIYGPGGDEEFVPMAKLTEERKSIVLHSSGEFKFNLSLALCRCRGVGAGARLISVAGTNSHVRCRINCVPEANQVHGQDPEAVGNLRL